MDNTNTQPGSLDPENSERLVLTDHDESNGFRDFHAFPDTLTLSKLADHVYRLKDPSISEISLPEDWKIHRFEQCEDGYAGAAYINRKKGHVVISHQGTCSGKDFWADITAVFLNWTESQIPSAINFTQAIVHEFGKDLSIISISVTGHSLGGWLAQISTFCTENPVYIRNSPDNEMPSASPYHLHTVVFETPGCLAAIQSRSGNPKRYNIPDKSAFSNALDALDITVLLSEYNLINSHREHVGRVLKLHIGLQYLNYFNPARLHNIKGIVEYLKNDPKITEIHDWSLYLRSVDGVDVQGSRYLLKELTCNISVFNSIERNFLEQVLRLRDYNMNFQHFVAQISEKFDHVFWNLDSIPVFSFDLNHRQVRLDETSSQQTSIDIDQFITYIKCLLIKNPKWQRTDFVKEIIQDIQESNEQMVYHVEWSVCLLKSKL